MRGHWSTLAPLWVMVPVTFLVGWAFAFTIVGAVLIFAATGLALVLLALQRTPGDLAAFTVITSLGWWVVFMAWPLAIFVPAGLLYLAWDWHLRRRAATRRAAAR